MDREENINKVDLKLKTQEAIDKARKIIDKHKGKKEDCSIEVSLAYDMQYVERYIQELITNADETIIKIGSIICDYGKKWDNI